MTKIGGAISNAGSAFIKSTREWNAERKAKIAKREADCKAKTISDRRLCSASERWGLRAGAVHNHVRKTAAKAWNKFQGWFS